MSLKFFNTLTRQLEPFTPADPDGKKVAVYTCGPTVYSHAHIGNFRAYIFEDLLQRHLESCGYQVARVMNLTDVDDKTIRGCRECGVSLEAFTAPFKEAFFQDLKTLRIKPADQFPAATEPENIREMISMITTLMEKGLAYQAEDGSVYFRIHKFPNYGALAHLDLEELRPSGRVRSDEYEKESLGDFALWKAHDTEDGDVGWESPWGRGRPGWHIECSAMATRILGRHIDIHCGGVDNIFPHHEAEIAQSEGCYGHPFVRYWLHCAHLLVESKKMAKSEGNFFTLRDLLEKGFKGREVRYALLSVHYRQPLNFTFDGLVQARSSLERIDEWVERLAQKAGPESSGYDPGHGFAEALDDDLNISAALGFLFDVIRDTHRRIDEGTLSGADARALLDWWQGINQVLRFEPEELGIPDKVQELVARRQEARQSKDWALSDQLRDEITAAGWSVKDTPEGPRLTPVKP